LLEWSATGQLKVGMGNPADTNTDVNPAGALGFQLAGRLDYGILPLNRQCGTLYLSAGTGMEVKVTAMDPTPNNGVHDGLVISSPDARADIYVRIGIGLACISNDLVLIASPYVARRSDSIAASSGNEIGVRGALLLTASLTAVLEAST